MCIILTETVLYSQVQTKNYHIDKLFVRTREMSIEFASRVFLEFIWYQNRSFKYKLRYESAIQPHAVSFEDPLGKTRSQILEINIEFLSTVQEITC